MLKRLMVLFPWLDRPIVAVAALPAVRRRRSRAPDHQRSRLYRWEAEAIFPGDKQPLTLEQCRALVVEAYRWAEGALAQAPGWQPPELTDGRGRRHACGSRQVIKLPRWARTRPVVLHECAHGLAPDKHGPRFVAVYIALVERFLGQDAAQLRQSAEAAGLLVGKLARGASGELVAKGRRAPPRQPTSPARRSTRSS